MGLGAGIVSEGSNQLYRAFGDGESMPTSTRLALAVLGAALSNPAMAKSYFSSGIRKLGDKKLFANPLMVPQMAARGATGFATAGIMWEGTKDVAKGFARMTGGDFSEPGSVVDKKYGAISKYLGVIGGGFESGPTLGPIIGFAMAEAYSPLGRALAENQGVIGYSSLLARSIGKGFKRTEGNWLKQKLGIKLNSAGVEEGTFIAKHIAQADHLAIFLGATDAIGALNIKGATDLALQLNKNPIVERKGDLAKEETDSIIHKALDGLLPGKPEFLTMTEHPLSPKGQMKIEAFASEAALWETIAPRTARASRVDVGILSPSPKARYN